MTFKINLTRISLELKKHTSKEIQNFVTLDFKVVEYYIVWAWLGECGLVHTGLLPTGVFNRVCIYKSYYLLPKVVQIVLGFFQGRKQSLVTPSFGRDEKW